MAFVSEVQRKFVMAKLREKGFKQKPIKISGEGKYFRARILNPRKFQKGSFRVVGRKGHSKIIVARPIGKRTTSTQAVIIPKKDIRRLK